MSITSVREPRRRAASCRSITSPSPVSASGPPRSTRQWRNLNIDPELYLMAMPADEGEPMGLVAELARLKKRFPALRYGYFNPPVPPRG